MGRLGLSKTSIHMILLPHSDHHRSIDGININQYQSLQYPASYTYINLANLSCPPDNREAAMITIVVCGAAIWMTAACGGVRQVSSAVNVVHVLIIINLHFIYHAIPLSTKGLIFHSHRIKSIDGSDCCRHSN
jgi:hypothetical protein